MMTSWDDDEIAGLDRQGAIAVGIVVVAIVGGLLATVLGMPVVLSLPMMAFFGIWGVLHWLFTVRLPERPLGFWTIFAIDSALGVWLLISFIALCKHGGWDWLLSLADHLGRPDPKARPDAVWGALVCAFVGLQLIRVGEDAPWGEAIARRISPTFLHFGIKIGIIVGLVVFLENGGEAWVKGLFSPP